MGGEETIFDGGSYKLVAQLSTHKPASLEVVFTLPPASGEDQQRSRIPMLELHVAGDDYDEHHGMKHVGSATSRDLRVVSYRTFHTGGGQTNHNLCSKIRLNG